MAQRSMQNNIHEMSGLTSEQKAQALTNALAEIDKNFGKGSVMRLGDEVKRKVPVVSTGSLALDIALGIGGLPRGRVIEIYGPESSGKTTLTLHAIAEAQKAGGVAAFIDAEHALDPEYAQRLGVDTDSLLVSQPDTGEQALEIADMLIRSGSIDIIVIDSVAALTPRAEIEGDMGDSHVGLQARLMSQALRKITGALNITGTTAIFINQLREKIGVFFGSPETTTGGKALKFYASVRLDIRRREAIKEAGEVIGNRTEVKVVKNKMAPPFRSAEFDIFYGEGISKESSLIDVGSNLGVIKKSGSWYTYGTDQLGQGKENARVFLKDNPELVDEIDHKVRIAQGLIEGDDIEDAGSAAGAATVGAATASGAAVGTVGTGAAAGTSASATASAATASKAAGAAASASKASATAPAAAGAGAAISAPAPASAATASAAPAVTASKAAGTAAASKVTATAAASKAKSAKTDTKA